MDTTLTRTTRESLLSWGIALAQATAGAYFVVAGLLKLLGAPPMVAAFARWDWPGSARVAIGVVELLSGVALVLPRFARVSALTMAALLVASQAVHLAKLDPLYTLLEPLLLVPLLLVVANAHAPGGAAQPFHSRASMP